MLYFTVPHAIFLQKKLKLFKSKIQNSHVDISSKREKPKLASRVHPSGVLEHATRANFENLQYDTFEYTYLPQNKLLFG